MIGIDIKIDVIEDQIRESFGRVAWTHKTHEKASDIARKNSDLLKNIQMIISAVTTSGLMVSLVGDNKAGAILGTVFSTILLIINLIFKNYDYSLKSNTHAEVAVKLWNIREEYISLLTDINMQSLEVNEIIKKRDLLQEKVFKIYQNAPRTDSKAYNEASKGLKEQEELTFSDEEIDKFLPRVLRKKGEVTV